MLFKSSNFKGVVMNQYGIAIYKGVILEQVIRNAVREEAKAAGWKLENSPDKDVGLIYTPPAAPEEGMGSE